MIAVSSRTAGPCPFHRPASCEAALAALADHSEPPILVAGGTDLCAQFNEGLVPSAMVALDRIAALREIALEEGELRIGAGVTHAEGAAHPLVRRHLPGFAAAWARIANVRVRAWATIGGNLMARRPRYEMAILLTALEARLRFLDSSGERVERTPPEILAGGAPSRALLHHVAIPLREGAAFHYDRTLRPIMTLALSRDESGCRAVIATEYLFPVALAVDPALAPAAAAEAALAGLPEDFADPATSNWYLRRAGTVLLRRGLEAIDGAA